MKKEEEEGGARKTHKVSHVCLTVFDATTMWKFCPGVLVKNRTQVASETALPPPPLLSMCVCGRNNSFTLAAECARTESTYAFEMSLTCEASPHNVLFGELSPILVGCNTKIDTFAKTRFLFCLHTNSTHII